MSKEERGAELFFSTLEVTSKFRRDLLLAASINHTSVPVFIVSALKSHVDEISKQFEGMPVEVQQEVFRQALVTAHDYGKSRGPKVRGNAQTIAENKKAFLEAFEEGGSTYGACRSVGVSQSMPYIWARSDPDFLGRWNAARAEFGAGLYEP